MLGLVKTKLDQRFRNFERAITDFDKAIDLKPTYAPAYYNRGAVYRKKGDFERAIADFDKAIDLKPTYAPAYYNRGAVYRKKGDFERAIADFTKVIELKLDLSEVYYNRGEARLHLQEWEDAKSDLTVAIGKGISVIAMFHDSYVNIADFESKNGIRLPVDIVEMLKPQRLSIT